MSDSLSPAQSECVYIWHIAHLMHTAHFSASALIEHFITKDASYIAWVYPHR